MIEGKSTHALRGDYSRCRPDYSVEQDMGAYSDTDRAVWQQLARRQPPLVRSHAIAEFAEGIRLMGLNEEIPDLARTSALIAARTGWVLVPVPGLIPDREFFDYLANRRFPVSVWVRKPEELDYLVEPDLFHDYFGHVPLLLNPVFADYLVRYGEIGRALTDKADILRLSRLYWYMVEFGLIHTNDGLRAYGAGMLSSRSETIYSVENPKPHRLWFDLERVLCTSYMIDDFQKTYFVLPDFDTLFRAMDADFPALFRRLEARPVIDPASLVAGDRIYSRGTITA